MKRPTKSTLSPFSQLRSNHIFSFFVFFLNNNNNVEIWIKYLFFYFFVCFVYLSLVRIRKREKSHLIEPLNRVLLTLISYSYHKNKRNSTKQICSRPSKVPKALNDSPTPIMSGIRKSKFFSFNFPYKPMKIHFPPIWRYLRVITVWYFIRTTFENTLLNVLKYYYIHVNQLI